MTQRDLFALGNFSADSLEEIVERIDSRAQEGFEFPSAVLTLRTACARIAGQWDGPVTTAEYDTIRARFEPLLRQLIDSLARGNAAEVQAAADGLAKRIFDPEGASSAPDSAGIRGSQQSPSLRQT